MKTVFKYPLLFVGDYCDIKMPIWAEIVYVRYEPQSGGDICIWAVVDTNKTLPTEVRTFRIAGTGHELDKHSTHLATFKGIEGPYIWHIFEVPTETLLHSGQETGVGE